MKSMAMFALIVESELLESLSGLTEVMGKDYEDKSLSRVDS